MLSSSCDLVGCHSFSSGNQAPPSSCRSKPDEARDVRSQTGLSFFFESNQTEELPIIFKSADYIKKKKNLN
jgi:hypothetical protein